MKSRLLGQLTALLLMGSVRAAEPIAPPPVIRDYPLEAYAAVGSYFAQNTRLADLGWNETQFEAFIEGVRATFKGQPRAVDAQAQSLHEEIGRRLQQIAAIENQTRKEYFADPARLEAYMKEASKKFNMERTDSGLAYAFVKQGNGTRPAPEDSVVITYKVTAADAKTDLPQLNVMKKTFKVSALMPGLAEMVQMMTVSSAVIMILPPDLTYGTGEWPPGTDPGAPLLFMLVLDQVMVAP